MDVPYWQPLRLQQTQQPLLPPGQPMDTSADEQYEGENIPPIIYQSVIPFTSETCLQRRIAYVITTIAMSLIKKKDVFYPAGNGIDYHYNCLPQARFKFIVNQHSGAHYGLDRGESLGRVMIPDESCTHWESREIVAGVNVQLNYYKICFAAQVLSKQLARPSHLMAGRAEEIKHQIPVVAEIWNHFHVLIGNLAEMTYQPKEWKEVVGLVRESFQDIIDVQEMSLNFANPAVSPNHQALYIYMKKLAANEWDFVQCFERVCREWDDLKHNWKPEEKEALAESQRLIKMGML